jgi:cyclase
MLKSRVIPVLLLKNGLIIRSEIFKYHQIIGDPTTQLERYNKWNVDELIYIDISTDDNYDVRRSDAKISTSESKNILDIISEISRVCFVPLTFGGRIRTMDDIRKRLQRGADKITLNTAAIENPEFITESANAFGSQCIVVSIDVKSREDGSYEVFKGGREVTGLDPTEWAVKVAELGAGEILLNSIDRDGTAKGYDLELINSVAEKVDIPVIAMGGVGHWMHMRKCLESTNCAAVAAANIFNFTEMSYIQSKKYLLKHNQNVRKPYGYE